MKKKAEYQISTSVNGAIAEIVVKGKLIKDSFEKRKNAIFAIEKQMNIKSELLDFRELRGRPSYAEVYMGDLPPNRQRINTAFVDIAENANDGLFYEKIALNDGLSFKWFSDIDAARTWLKKKAKKMKWVSR
jgi:hypothetical protein